MKTFRVLAVVAAALMFAPLAAQAAAKGKAPDTKPPKITHVPVDEAAAGKVLTISAKITDESEIFEPTLYYRPAGSKKFLSASMMKGEGSVFTATIPDAAMAGEVEYFIEAYDVNGNGPSRFASEKAPHKIKTTGGKAEVAKPEPEKPADSKPADAKPADTKVAEVVAPPPPPPAQVEQRSSSTFPPMRVAGITVGGLGVAGLVAGAVCGVRAKGLDSDAKADTSASSASSKYNSAKSSALGADVGFIAGGVLAAVGVVLAVLPVFTSSSSGSHESGEHSLESRLMIGPSGASYALTF